MNGTPIKIAMRSSVDSLIVIDNNKLYRHYGSLSIWDAFHKADEVLSTAVEGILGIIEKTGYINVDLNDVQAMMRDSGMALMGTGCGTGENRVEVTIIATGVDMMGAVPEDYYSEDREFVPVQLEIAPEVEEPIISDVETMVPEANEIPEEESTGLIKVISRIRDEVARMYNSAGDIHDSEE